jgi:hypothetical protein
MTISLLCALGTAVLTGQAATTFIGSIVTAIDQTQRTITIHTKEGQSWTLPVADPDILKKERVSKGDQVSIEIDLNDRVTKIIKLSEQPRSEQTQSLDDLKP